MTPSIASLSKVSWYQNYHLSCIIYASYVIYINHILSPPLPIIQRSSMYPTDLVYRTSTYIIQYKNSKGRL